ncbi:Protein mlp1 [Massospora cicadina]|nr:Protein mlp1 [Massospora cicadina]
MSSSSLNQLKTDNQVLKTATELYLKQRDELIQKLVKSHEACNEVNLTMAKQEQRFQTELSNQTNLVTFYRNLSETLEKRVRVLENELTSSTLEHQRYIAKVEIIEEQTKESFNSLHAETKALVDENEKLLAVTSDENPAAPLVNLKLWSCLQFELLRAKRDNRDLQQNLKELVANIKLKQPILEEQKHRFDLLVAKNNELSAQLTKCSAERDQAEFETRETKARIHQFSATEKSLKRQVARLSLQVQIILSQREAPTASSILEAHLTPFKDIQGLQKQNMELQAIVEELATRCEAEEERLKAKVDELQSALDGDTKALVERTTAEIKELNTKIQHLEGDLLICERIIKRESNTQEHETGGLPEHRLIIARLENELTALKKAKDEEHFKALSKVEGLLVNLTTKDVQIAHLNATITLLEDQLHMNEEELKLLVHNANQSSLRTAEVEGQLIELNCKICQLSCDLEKEKVLTAHSAQASQLMLQELADLRALSASWRDERDSLATKVVELSVEVERLKKSLEGTKITHNSIQEQLQKSIISLEAERDEALNRSNACFQVQESQAIQHERFLLASKERISQFHIQSQIKTYDLQMELRNTKDELLQQRRCVAELQTELEAAQNHARSKLDVIDLRAVEEVTIMRTQLQEKSANYQTVCEALDEIVTAYTQLETQAQNEIAEEKEKFNQSQLLQQRQEDQVKSLTKELLTLQNESESRIRKLLKEKDSFEKEVQLLKLSLKELEDRLCTREEMIASLNSIVDRATSSYDEELVHHADKIHTINALKAELQECKAQITGFQNQPTSFQTGMESNDKLAAALSQLLEANATIRELEQQILTLRAQSESAGPALNIKPGAETEQLIKQCSDDALLKVDSLTNANKLLQLDMASLTASLNQARHELAVERERCQTLHQTELQEKALQIKLLDESNQYLRGEHNQLTSKLSNLEKEMKVLLGQLEPMRVEELMALKSDIAAKDSKLELLRWENDECTAQLQKLLLQEQHIDPLEHEAIKADALLLQEKLATSQKIFQELEECIASDSNTVGKLREKNAGFNCTGLYYKKKLEQLEAERGSTSSAPEEHLKLQEEHTTLLSEYQDILKSLEAKVQRLLMLQDLLGVPEGELVKGIGDLKKKLKELEKALEAQKGLNSHVTANYK